MPRANEGGLGHDEVGFEFGSEWYLPLLGGGEDIEGMGGGDMRDRRRSDRRGSLGSGLGSQFDFSSLFGGTGGNTLQNTLMLLQLLQGGGTAGGGEELNLFSDISTGV